MGQRTPAEIRSNTGTCHKHMGKSKASLPAGLSEDIDLFSLDVGAKQRVHGCFVRENFFLIWLDREHKFFS